ncbi:MAG: hypothetical protein KQI78_08715 [Deltaproteobacteria bacterium]|nr:hypothetical protein [Deltaproteobacteria bacterium]
MLVGGFVLPGIALAQNGGKYFNDDGFVGWNIESVEGPEMRHVGGIGVSPDESQPGDATVGGFADRAGAVQFEDALGRGSPFFGQSKFGMVACSLIASAEGFSSDIVLVSGPVLLKVLEELIPGSDLISFHVIHGKGEAVIDPEDGRIVSIQEIETPMGNFLPCPIEFLSGGRFDPNRIRIEGGFEYP